MKSRILLFALFVFSSLSLGAQTEDFEDEMVGDTTFTVNGVLFTMTNELLISEFDDFSCDGTLGLNKYMDSGFLDMSGELGTFAPVDTNFRFQVSTTAAQCGWPGQNDGDNLSTGTIRFIGTKSDGSTISEDFELTSTTFNDMVPFTFSEAIWAGVDLRSMEIDIAATQDATDYFALDNLVFESLISVSTEDLQTHQEIDIFPNPTNGIVNIRNFTNGQVTFYNNVGSLMLVRNASTPEINISAFPDGIYFMLIQTDEGLKTRRIVKQE